MQDHGKRLLLAVALALGVMLVWQRPLFGRRSRRHRRRQGGDSTAQTDAAGRARSCAIAASGRAKSEVGRRRSTPAPTSGAAARGPEQTIALKFPNVVATFSSYGGVLTSWRLTDPRYDHDATKGELHPEAS